MLRRAHRVILHDGDGLLAAECPSIEDDVSIGETEKKT